MGLRGSVDCGAWTVARADGAYTAGCGVPLALGYAFICGIGEICGSALHFRR
jgi:hypothetical protein